MIHVCAMCDRHLSSKDEFVVMNRYAVSGDRGCMLIQGVGEDDDYEWDMDDALLTGQALCLNCVVPWLQGHIISIPSELKRNRDG